eukprot:s1714_g9.t1
MATAPDGSPQAAGSPVASTVPETDFNPVEVAMRMVQAAESAAASAAQQLLAGQTQQSPEDATSGNCCQNLLFEHSSRESEISAWKE